MMTKTTSKKKACCRTLALVPVFFAAIAFFTTKMTANVLPEQLSALNTTADETVIIPGQGISSEGLNEYKGIVDKYLLQSTNMTNIKGKGKKIEYYYTWKSMELSDEDYNRLYVLYIQMTPEQRKEQPIHFSGIFSFQGSFFSPSVNTWKSLKSKNTIFMDGEKMDASKIDAVDRESIIYFNFNDEKSTSFLWTKKGYDDYMQKYGKQIPQAELLKIQAEPWFYTHTINGVIMEAYRGWGEVGIIYHIRSSYEGM